MSDPAYPVMLGLLISVVVGLNWAADRAMARHADKALATAFLLVALLLVGVGFAIHIPTL